MRGKRAKALMEQARLAAMDGSVIKSHEYKRLKKLHVNPHYATVTMRPGFSGATTAFTGKERLERLAAKEAISR